MFETNRLKINEFRKSDAKAFSFYRNKPEVAKYQSWTHYPLFRAIARINYTIKHPFEDKEGDYQLAIRLKDSDVLIGDLFIEVNNNNQIYLGYTLDNDYWHQGYAFETIAELLLYVRYNTSVNEVRCYVLKDNVASINLLNRLGFKECPKTKIQGDKEFKYIVK